MTATAWVSNIPLWMTAEELLEYLESEVEADCVYAVEISSEHKLWKSRGSGRVQFASPGLLEKSIRMGLAVESQPLTLVPAAHDMIPRASTTVSCCVEPTVIESPERLLSLHRWRSSAVSLYPSALHISPPLPFLLRLSCTNIARSVWYPRRNALLLRLNYGPTVYQSAAASPNSDRFHAYKHGACLLPHSSRAVDFTPNNSLGFCDSLLLHFFSSHSPDFSSLPFYSISDQTFTLHSGAHLLSRTTLAPLARVFPDTPHQVLFQINSLIHFHKISLAAVTHQFLTRISDLGLNRSLWALNQLHKFPTTCYDPLTFVNSLVFQPQTEASSTGITCHRAMITPTKIFLMGPEDETSNSVLRRFAEYALDFIRVSFVDENWSKLPHDAVVFNSRDGIFSTTKKTQIHERILSILENGFVIGSKKYEFLAFSASQLRSRSLWMFASNEKLKAEDIRKWMGCFTSIRSVSKCAARMGQLFSSSRQTLQVRERDVEHLPDVECTVDGVTYCFSDGVGKISLCFAQQVAVECGLAHVPSVFQIRYGGYKGVLAVDRNSFRKLSLRPSMLKFSSENRMLNVTSWSKPMPCYLNREIVTLLTTLGVPDDRFEILLRDQLELMSIMDTDPNAAIAVLKNLVSNNDDDVLVKMMSHGYEPRREPYLSMMLKSCYETLYASLRGKCKVFVPNGRVLVGCLDEVGNLEYGQVFVKVTKRTGCGTDGRCVLKGRVAVTRNPCLHPGDIRVLEAVYDAALDEKELVDCLVFPQKGLRPHPNECSGGDLDGDLFFLTWDEGLIPREMDAPMDYLGGRPRIMDHEVKTEEIQKFFVDYMVNDNLGLISNAHLIHADCDREKARSENCLHLASLHSMAVDFAKSGAPAEMPRYLIPNKFPDFMERVDKPVYESQSILGKLYRMTVAAARVDLKVKEMEDDAYDRDLEVEGFEEFIEIARNHREMYSDRMGALMNYYGAKGEDEILTGNLRNREMYLQRDNRIYIDVIDRISEGVKCLRRDAKEWFAGGCSPMNRRRLASAWYSVVYHPSFRGGSVHCLSFPWVVGDTLLSIKSANKKQQVSSN